MEDTTTMVTTVRRDYRPPPAHLSHTQAIRPPPPASVLHKNAYFIRMPESLTQSTYRPPGKDIMERANDSGHMYSTNFHLDADRRLETHRTTAQDGFQPVQPLDNTNRQNTQRSTGLGVLGTTSVNPLACSEYARSFAGTSGTRTLAQGPEWSTRDTITGSSIRGSNSPEDHLTTHTDTYRGQFPSCPNPTTHTVRLQQLRTTSIPLGDPYKAGHTRPSSLLPLPPPPSSNSRYNKSEAVGTILGSSIRLSDHTTSPQDQFSTTATDTYHVHHHPGRVGPLLQFHRNASFLPPGDLDPHRVQQRLSHVTTQAAHNKPPSGSYPTHIDSSNLHTLSYVHMGASPLQPFDNSTMAASYPPISAPTLRIRAPAKDNIPLNYHPGYLCRSTTADAYRTLAGARMTRTTPHENVSRLKCSHWQLPSMGPPCYSTTHRGSYRAT